MKITKIEEQKKNKSRMSVFIDDEFAFGADAYVLLAHHLKEGDEITEEQLTHIKSTSVFEDAKSYAARLVSARSYTEKAMRTKLIAHTGDEETVDKTIAFLKEYKLIDDYDFARRYAHDLVHLKKFGLRQVKLKLREKGITDSVCEEVLSQLDFEDTISENLKSLVIKKLAGNYDIKNIMKVKRYLLSRGYSYDMINAAFSGITSEDGENDW